MNELITTSQNEQGEIIMSGRELYEFLEVTTPYTIWFERMSEYGFIEGQDFITKMLESTGGRPKQDHHIKLDMAKEIAMIQRSDKGKEARQYFLQLEKMWNSPDMVIKRAMDFQQRKILELENQIKSDMQYTNFGKVVAISDGSINVGAFAKLIYDEHGIKIGRNKLLEWLRDKGYLIKSGREKNFPKQQYVEQGLFELKPTIVKRTEGDIQSGTTMITGKGQIKLTDVLLQEFKRAEVAN
ncbi:antA/AntB antirepressor family protein [Metabacillus sp. Hm71]|uniref:antA/AntB antirepressor family protein n=1 Tax=Metabacillus sp. Hm71 TaxID=3450743 RepID=UPI003F443D60